MPVKIPTVQTGLEASIQSAAKKAGRNLKINMGGNAKSIEGLSQPLGRITGKADQFTKSMEAANARVLAFGASVGILAAVTRGFKELVLTTIEVEKSLISINSILGTSTKELEGFSKTIFNVAKNTEQSFSTVATAALELSRQGLTATEVQKRLSDSLILTRLSGLGATEAVSGLTAAINSFNKSGLSSSEILNKLSAAAVSAAVSERDLIEGIKRAGSVASLAGVSFDELVGVITAVQVKTARGGAVIGNSFKTIFTRIQSIDKLETMQNLGVQVTDASGKVLGATKLIQNLSKVLGELPEAKRLQIAEGLVGKFQIAPFLAILDDYNSKTSIAIDLTKVSQNATKEAYERNVALNESLSAAINKSTVNLKELADTLGKIGVTDNLRNLLGFFNTLVEDVKGILDGEGAGGDFARGIVKGIGAVISGPGLAIFGAIIIKLGVDLARFGLGSLKTFFGLNRAAKEQATLQGQIASTLLGNKGIQEKILAIENSSLSAEKKKVEQTKFFTTAIREQLGVMQQMQGIASTIAPGVRAGTRPVSRRGGKGRAAGGFIPNYNAIAGYGSESSDISKGVGGAPTSAKPVTIPNFNFGGGQKGSMVANSSEFIVPNYAGSGGSAIFNQDMVSSMGMPAGARKISAAGGYIPNFAEEQKTLNSQGRHVLLYGQTGKSEPENLAYYHPEENKYNVTKRPGALPIRVPTYGLDDKHEGKTVDEYIKELEDYSIKQGIKKSQELSGGMPKPVHNQKIKAKVNSGAVAGFAGSIYELALATMLTDKEFKNYADQAENSNFDLNLTGQDKLLGLFNIQTKPKFGEVKGRLNPKNVASAAAKIHRVLGKKQDAQTTKLKGKKLSRTDALKYLGITTKSSKGHVIREQDREKFMQNVPKDQRPKFDNRGFFSGFVDIKNASRGYIPNFANPLQDAIGREQAAGLPVNQIRVNQSPKLRNADNPMGLAVTNTRDEPTGAIPNFAESNIGLGDIGTESKRVGASLGKLNSLVDSLNKEIKEGTITQDGAEKSLKKFTQGIKTNGEVRNKVNNVAKERLNVESKTTKGSRDMLGGIFATQIAFSALAGATSEAEDGFGRVANRLTTMGSSITTAVFAGSAIKDFGESMEGAKGKVVESLGQIGTAIGIGAAVFKGLTKLYEDGTGITDTNNMALRKLADAADKAAIKLSGIGEVDKAALEKQRDNILADIFNKKADGEAANGIVTPDVSIPNAFLDTLAQSIDNALVTGVDSDILNKLIRKSAMGGEKEIVAKDLLNYGSTDTIKIDKLDDAEFDKLIDTINKMKAGTQDVSKLFENLNKQQLKALIAYGDLGTPAANMGVDGAQVQYNLAKQSFPIMEEFRKGMAGTGMTGKKAQNVILNQEAEKAPAKLKIIEKNATNEATKAARVNATVAKNEINDAIERVKAEREQLEIIELQILAAKTTGSLTKTEIHNLEKQREEIDKNLKLRNATVTAAGKIINQSKELTFVDGISMKIKVKLANIIKQGLATEEDRVKVLGLANDLIAENDAAVKASLVPIMDGLARENERIEGAKKFLGLQKQITFEFSQQETSIEAAAIRARTADNEVSAEAQLGFRSQIDEIKLKMAKRSGDPLSNPEAKAREISNAKSQKKIVGLEKKASTEERESGQREQFRTLMKNPIIKGQLEKITNTEGTEGMEVVNKILKSIDGLKGDDIIKKFRELSSGVSKLAASTGDESLSTLAAQIDETTASLVENNAIAKKAEDANSNLADAAVKAAGKLKELALGQLGVNMADDLRKGATQGKFNTDRISDPVARLKAQISEDSRMERANAAQDPAEIRRILRSDEEKFREIDNNMNINPVERIKNRRNERSQADRDAAVDNQDFKEFRRLVEEDQFNGKLIDASAQFAQNIGDAMTEAIIQGGNLGDILIGTATSFFTTLSKAYMTRAVDSVIGKFASGGKVTGGSGNRDDVPALLTGGEFVMKKSSVSKYGSSFMESLNAGSIPAMARGGLFTPGTYGQEEIKGKSNLLDFATQSFTTGASDRFGSGAGSASVNLEPQSAALTMFGRRNSPAFQREQASKQDAFGLFTQQIQKEEQAREEKRQAKKALKNSIIGAVVSAGFSSLASKFGKAPLAEAVNPPNAIKVGSMSDLAVPGTLIPRNATGGAIPNAAGVDTVPSMLSGGEFVMNAAATQKIGRGSLNALNSGADGGSGDIVGKLDELISVSDNAGETVINITVNSDGSSDTQGDGDDQQKSLATKIKDVVRQVIDDEKRLGGSLRQVRA